MKKILILSMIMLGIIVGCDRGQGSQREVKKNMAETKETGAVATFAGGCFWCVESDFEKVPGVLKVVSGYTGGTGENPTYETYARQGYVEAVQIFYDPAKISYAQLLDVFWRHIDPTDGGDSSSIAGLNTGARSSTTTRSSGGLRRNPKRSWGNREDLPNRS